MQLTKNFSNKELQCPCCGKVDMNHRLMDLLQSVRDEVGFPFVINSGFRCKKRNAELPSSSPKSQHLVGKAVDVSTRSLTANQKHALLKSAFRKGFNGIGIYPTFIHLDVRDDPVFFTKITV